MIYYFLNYIPSILYVVIMLSSIEVGFGVGAIVYLFVQPLYLLIVNASFVCKKSISYTHSIICMLSVVIFNGVYTIIEHKIRTGYFAGDVPIDIYILMFGVPIVVIVLGIGILYLLKR